MRTIHNRKELSPKSRKIECRVAYPYFQFSVFDVTRSAAGRADIVKFNGRNSNALLVFILPRDLIKH